MTGPPTAPAAGGPRRAPKSGRPEGRTAGRHELARHPRFAEISPEVGVLDEEAMSRALAGDPTAFELLALMTTATDERLRAAAIRLSAQIVLDRARAGRPAMGGVSRLRTARGALDGDLDIDASIEGVSAARAEARPVGHDDLTTVHWARPRTAFAVVVDRSGSMGGARLAAAATVAAACALRAPQEHAVLTFAATVDVIRPLASDIAAAAVAERLLGLRGHGVTRLADALKAAREQLAPARARRRVVILLSDCRGTDEDDTLETARSLPELIILAPADDHEQAAQLADLSGARWAPLAHPLDAAAALDQLLEVPADQRLGLCHEASPGGGGRPARDLQPRPGLAGMADADDVRRLAMSLPHVEEIDSDGFDFRVGGKGFVWSYPERKPGQRRVIRTDVAVLYVGDEAEKQALLLGEPRVFFTTSGYDGWPLVMLRLAEVDVDRLTELVTDAWRMRAPHELAGDLEG